MNTLPVVVVKLGQNVKYSSKKFYKIFDTLMELEVFAEVSGLLP